MFKCIFYGHQWVFDDDIRACTVCRRREKREWTHDHWCRHPSDISPILFEEWHYVKDKKVKKIKLRVKHSNWFVESFRVQRKIWFFWINVKRKNEDFSQFYCYWYGHNEALKMATNYMNSLTRDNFYFKKITREIE